MKIYTKTGDKGLTSLASGQRIAKTDLRLEAYGTADELNSIVGWLRAALPTQAQRENEQLTLIQHRLFDLGARLAGAELAFDEGLIEEVEGWMDEMQASLPECHEFLLPAGNEPVARCHIARTVTRRLERAMVRLEKNQVSEPDLIFINRLSDYFFLLAKSLGVLTSAPITPWIKVK